ncbi:hypothetical protein [Dongshaea marina]|uniref:hypothetical protein n=1 Tax=Dongshaea marina TaxID=2047966 RepID=UPI000D3EBDA1|nr:hypothetical protein [Dongshaea marina]
MRWILLLTVLFTTTAATSPKSPFISDIKQQMEADYLALDQKVASCLEQKAQNSLTSILDPWFNQLSKLQMTAVVLVMDQLAMNACFHQQELDYTSSMLNYTAASDDRSYLDEWLTFKKSLMTNKIARGAQGISLQKIKLLAQSQSLSTPFNPDPLLLAIKRGEYSPSTAD